MTDERATPPEEERGGVAAFFDLDKTIIAKAATVAFREPLYSGGLLSRRAVARALLAQVVYLHIGASEQRVARMREVILRLTKGWSRDQVREVVEAALERTMEPIIYGEALDLIDEHRCAGHTVVIVSASPEEIVVPLARHLSVDATIASRAEVDSAGRYTGEMAFYAYGPYKAEAIAEYSATNGIDAANSYAYSDSYTDVPMLESVGHPVAVNPDRVLSRLANERGWEVLHFVRHVKLRDRVRERVHAPRPAVSLGAAALGTIAIALGWVLGNRRRAAQR